MRGLPTMRSRIGSLAVVGGGRLARSDEGSLASSFTIQRPALCRECPAFGELPSTSLTQRPTGLSRRWHPWSHLPHTTPTEAGCSQEPICICLLSICSTLGRKHPQDAPICPSKEPVLRGPDFTGGLPCVAADRTSAANEFDERRVLCRPFGRLIRPGSQPCGCRRHRAFLES